MLILTRRKGEVLRIGEEVELTVLGVKGGQVRLGIKAPTDIPVHREEIYLRLQAEKAQRAPPPLSPAPGKPRKEPSVSVKRTRLRAPRG